MKKSSQILSQIRDTNKPNDIEAARVLCNEHKSEDVILYCDDCEVLVCRDCIRNEHKRHTIIKFKDKVADSRACLKVNLDTLSSTRLPNLQKNLQDVVSVKETKDQEHKDMLSDITARADFMIEKINFIREQLMDRCEDLHKKNEEEIEKKIAQINARIELFENAEAFGKGALEHGEDEEIIHQDLELRRQLHLFQPLNVGENIDTPIYTDGELNEYTLREMYGKVISEIREQEEKRPELKVKNVSMFICGEDDIIAVCPFKTDLAWVHPRKGNYNIMVHVKGHQMSSLDPGFIVTSLAASQNGIIYMSDYKTNRIFSMDSSKKIAAEITLSIHPVGLGVCSNGDVLICLTDEWIYNTTTKSQRKMIRMTKKFKEKQAIELDDQGENLFTLPLAVSENVTKDICIVDKMASDRGRLCVFNESGKLRFIYQHPGDKLAFDPSAVCCTRHSNIVVTDPANNAVEILSSDGEFLHFLITAVGGCISPLSLGKDPDDKVWIGCANGKCIVLKYGYTLPK